MTNFGFLDAEWPDVYAAARQAEGWARSDPRTACFHARRALEAAVRWIYKSDRSLRIPYDTTLSALIHEPTFRALTGSAVFSKARVIKNLGNDAVHGSRPIRPDDAVTAVRELFHVCFWVARTYARGGPPASGLTFDAALLPDQAPAPPQTQEQLRALAQTVLERDAELARLRDSRTALDVELRQLRAEIAEAKAANAATPDTHDYSEEETRDFFIDLLLRESGWQLDQARDREYRVSGMPNNQQEGFVDYVLWGGDGLPLAVVEAKRTKRDARVGQQQAKLYADCLERECGRRPVIFYTNGYEHWLWDDLRHPPRLVQGFYTKDELELMIQRRTTRQTLEGASIDSAIVERYYQTRAIRRIAEAFEKDNDRKSLLVMATGAGKTRTVIALVELLMRRGWVKRVLFLADRIALVDQAVGQFKRHLPAASPVNLVTEKNDEGRVYLSTYATIMNLIDQRNDDQRRFGAGYFDLVIIDEAHRSVYQKYGAIFEYFDSLLVGLTATPKEDVDHNTYRLFDLEDGVPTDAYTLTQAVEDGYLVPPRAVSVPLKFPRQGINYDDLSEEEKERWDEMEWSEDGDVPDAVEAAALNSWLFNEDTVEKALAHLMTHGQKVAGGDRLGKTIIFAKNHEHAVFIEECFNRNYPEFKGAFARLIDYSVTYAQTLIDDFATSHKSPHIAISVDMLDTGIDVPEIVNLVFFKRVHSKTKFWQMIGRGTRLCSDLFGPGQHKEFFYIFDFLENLEFFKQNPPTTEGSTAAPLTKNLFTHRLELARAIALKHTGGTERQGVGEERRSFDAPADDDELRGELIDTLRGEVAGMNLDNFVVRAQRRLVEKYQKPESWIALSDEDATELAQNIAGLPSARMDDDEEAKRFDLLLLRLQLAILHADERFERLRKTVLTLARSMEEHSSIPMIRAEMELIQDVQSESFWEGVTLPMLERVRRRLRGLVKLIEKTKKRPVYADFEDQVGEETLVDLPGFATAGTVNMEQFRRKALQFLAAHEDNEALRKLRTNEPLTPADIDSLENIMVAEGVGTPQEFLRAKEESGGLGVFIRSLVGLDRDAAKRAFSEFLDDQRQTADQIEFVNMIIDHLTARGVLAPAALYSSPFTDISPTGPDGVFSSSEVDAMLQLLEEVRLQAAP